MTNREIVQQLREAAQQKKMEYIVHSVRAKLLRKTLKESLFGRKSMNEDITPATSAPSGTRSTTTPSDVAKSMKHARVGSALYAKFPKPEEIEDSMIKSLDGPLTNTDPAVVFGTGSGPGTYRDLLKALKDAEDAVQGASTGVMDAEALIKAFQEDYPKFSADEQKKVRGAARKFLLGMKRGFGGGIK